MTDLERKDDLNEFFAAARAAPQDPGEALMARVLGDALDVQAAAASQVAADDSGGARPGVLAGLFGALGGWPAMAGLGTAATVGLWLGFSPALGLSDAMTSALGVASDDLYLVDYVSGYDLALDEGTAG